MKVKTHTALHVLKGAVQKVLKAKWTASVWVEGSDGRLTVQYDRKPTPQELQDIEKEANCEIQANHPVKEVVMGREKAEELWGDAIYDLFPTPEEIRNLKIVIIENWNINACKEEHTKTTGEVGKIVLTKVRFRDKKQLLELSFSIVDLERQGSPYTVST